MSSEVARKSNLDLAEDQLAALELIAAELVGVDGVDVAQNRVKRAMLREALSRTRGNLTKAALLLGVRRQAVQQMLDRYELKAWAKETRTAPVGGCALVEAIKVS